MNHSDDHHHNHSHDHKHDLQHHHHDHHSDHGHHGHSHSLISKNIFIAFLLNFVFAIIEVVGGIWTNSVAIQADALHDFGDSLSIFLIWYLNKLSHKPSSKHYSYGLARLRIFGALAIGLVLISGSVGLLFHSVPHLFKPEPVNAAGMIGLALMGVVVNGMAFLKLKLQKTLSEKMISLHMLEDLWGWVIVLFGAIVIHFWQIYWLDPLLSIALSIYIVWNALKNLYGAFGILLQGVTSPDLTEKVEEVVRKAALVKDLHHVHIWALDENYFIITAHIVVSGSPQLTEIQECKLNIQKELLKLVNCESTFEFEAENFECLDTHHKN